MGSWGSGHFDSDTAADHLAELVDRLVTEVEKAVSGDPVRLEPDEYWGVAVPCNLELLLTLDAQGWVGVTLPPPDAVRRWRTTYLAAWERGIDALEPTPEYRKERRAVLDDTFERLIAAAVRR
ncbi:DUF4259 domain-containing protein [Streptomyces fructofermentans]|uniref:DUF4259 domain-containing protein n=1 Tax=Streptomyces fructofermentans TaxID=152141 RepID=UPI0037B35D2D